MTSHDQSIDTISAWHDALNTADLARLLALTHPDVELAGPRGSASGVTLVRDWATQSGITLDPHRWFAHGDTVVVAQTAHWPDPESGTLGPPHQIATAFTLRDGLVSRIARHPDLPTALAATTLTQSDEISTPVPPVSPLAPPE